MEKTINKNFSYESKSIFPSATKHLRNIVYDGESLFVNTGEGLQTLKPKEIKRDFFLKPVDIYMIGSDFDYKHVKLEGNFLQRFLLKKSFHKNLHAQGFIYSFYTFNNWLVIKTLKSCEKLCDLEKLFSSHSLPLRQINFWHYPIFQELLKEYSFDASNGLKLIVFHSFLMPTKLHFLLVKGGYVIFSRACSYSKKTDINKQINETIHYLKRLPFIEDEPQVITVNIEDESLKALGYNNLTLTKEKEIKIFFQEKLFSWAQGEKVYAPTFKRFKLIFMISFLIQCGLGLLGTGTLLFTLYKVFEVHDWQKEITFLEKKIPLVPMIKVPKDIPLNINQYIELAQASQKDLYFLLNLHEALYKTIKNQGFISHIDYKVKTLKPLKKQLNFVIEPYSHGSFQRQWWADHLLSTFKRFNVVPRIELEQNILKISVP